MKNFNYRMWIESIRSEYTSSGQHNRVASTQTQALVMLAVRAFSMFSGLIVVSIFAKGLGPEIYGRYTLCVSLSMTLGILILGGTPTFITREIAADIARKEGTSSKSLERFSLAIITTGFIIFTIIFLILSNYPINWAAFQQLRSHYILIFLSAIAYSIQQWNVSILIGRSRQLMSQLPDGIIKPIAMIVLFEIVVALKIGSVEQALTCYLLGYVISNIAGSYFRLKTLPTKFNEQTKIKWSWFRQLPAFSLLSIVSIAQANADIFVLSTLIPIQDLGKYKVASLISTIPGNFNAVVIGLLQPRAAAAWATSDRSTLTNLAIISSRASFIFSLIFTISLFMFGKPLLLLAFGIQFSDIYPLAVMLCLGPVAAASVGSSFSILNMCGKAGLNSIISFSGIICLVVFLHFFTAWWGLIGSAYASLLVSGILAISSWSAVYYSIGIRSDAFASKKIPNNI